MNLEHVLALATLHINILFAGIFMICNFDLITNHESLD